MVQGLTMDVMPIPNTPALVIDDSILVVADLHVGMERELKEAGFILPSQTEKMTDRLISILKDQKPKRLVILGDLKHNIPKASRQEWDDVPLLVQAIQEYVEEVDILPGNHDGGIGRMLPNTVRVRSSRGMIVGDVGLFHGHAWPSNEVMSSKIAIMGHDHPTIMFVDSLGMKASKRCWVRTSFRRKSKKYERMPKELIVMPAFNDFCGGTPINDPKSKLLGPMLSNKFLVLNKSKIHLLDGTYLGLRFDLML
jgi:putative SbcD/Mre11-related phosphoesterase